MAIGAFSLWGLFPFYFKLLVHIHPLVILANRIIWSVVTLLLLLLLLHQWRAVQSIFAHKKQWLPLMVAALLIALNWGAYVTAVNTDQVFEASLGYYINPLMNVFLGFVILKERLRGMQWLAVLLAFIGVAIQIVELGQLPWLALAMAISFSIYGLIHKRIEVAPMPGLFTETLFLLPLALVFLMIPQMQPAASAPWRGNDYVILSAAGLVTITPLLLFTAAAKRLTYTTLGFYQYIVPSTLFLLAGFFYQEPFSLLKLTTFVFIWTALAIFSIDALRQQKKHRSSPDRQPCNH